MLHQLISYIAHLFKSFHLHGIHSPFIFQLEKKCLNDTTNYQDYVKLSRFRESVTHNNKYLIIEDHGAGSKVFKSNYRKISNILKRNSSTIKDARLLYRLCDYFKVSHVLELGTSLGIATHAMAVARPLAQIITVEGSKEVYDFAKENFLKTGLKNVDFVNATFTDFFTDHKNKTTIYDLVFIDGHHDGAATLYYFEQLLKLIHKDSIIVIHDIYWSKDMTATWDQICHHPQVSASINCYSLGIVLLREEQEQEQFYVRLKG